MVNTESYGKSCVCNESHQFFILDMKCLSSIPMIGEHYVVPYYYLPSIKQGVIMAIPSSHLFHC